jgi:hypothetical protein
MFPLSGLFQLIDKLFFFILINFSAKLTSSFRIKPDMPCPVPHFFVFYFLNNLKIPVNIIAPIFLSSPSFVVGTPVLRAKLCRIPLIPSALFQLNDSPYFSYQLIITNPVFCKLL